MTSLIFSQKIKRTRKMQPEENTSKVGSVSKLGDIIPAIAVNIVHLDSGLSASLRRNPFAGSGLVACCKLMSNYEVKYNDMWSKVIQAIAILTPKGSAANKSSAHDSSIYMGQSLEEADFSEASLSRLLSAPDAMRGDMVVRACRRLVSKNKNHFNLVTLARFILYGDCEMQIAKEYYRSNNLRHKGRASDG